MWMMMMMVAAGLAQEPELPMPTHDPVYRFRLVDVERSRHMTLAGGGIALGVVGRVAKVGPLVAAVGGAQQMVPVSVATSAAGLGGDVMTAIALERARADLRRRGIALDGTALHVGEAMSLSGNALIALGAGLMAEGDPKSFDAGFITAMVGAALDFGALIPFGVQHARTVAAYRRAPKPETPTVGVEVRPTVDPASRSLGLTGTF